MKLSAVIPVWNGRQYLERLLNSTDAQTLPFTEVLVIDNGSTDGAGDLAYSRGARVVRFANNHGFAAAVNRGVTESQGELIAVLNSDIELAPDWTELLLKAITARSAFFATGLILSAQEPGKIDGGWDLVSKAGMAWRAGNGAPANHALFQDARKIEMASFTAILLRRELWNRVGPLDQQFESYLEDVDFGLRCMDAGLGGTYEPKAVCFHQGSASLGSWNPHTVRRMSRNQVFLVRKHLAIFWWKLLVGQGLWGLLALRHGTGLFWLRGKIEGLYTCHKLPRKVLGVSQEAELFCLQAAIGSDAYWRWYGRLTGPKLRLNDTVADRE